MSALVHPEGGRSWLCSIRDFCEAGMLLSGSSATRRLKDGDDIHLGEEIALHFSVPTDGGQAHYRTRAAIARVLDGGNGIGVQFVEGLPDQAFRDLMACAVATGMARDEAEPSSSEPTGGGGDGALPEEFFRDKRIPEKDASAIRLQLRQLMERATVRIARRFFETAGEELLVKARDAGTNATQMMYFEGMDALEKNRDRIQASFAREVLRQIDHVTELEEILERRRRRESGNAGTTLQIVDTDQFEEWLAVAEIINKSEDRFGEELTDIRAQLGLIAKPWSHKDAVPVGPAALAWSFDGALGSLEFRRQVRQDVYKCLEQAMLGVLGNLYSAIGQLLTESGAFPSVEELRAAVQRRAIRRSPSGVQIDPDAYKQMDSSVRAAAMAADSVGANAAAAGSTRAVSGGAQAFDAASNMIAIERRARALMGKPADEMLAPADAPPLVVFDTSDILNALSEVQEELGDQSLTGVNLKSKVMDVLRARHGDDKRFAESDFNTIDVMENLVESLRADQLVTRGIREWIARLEITLLKLATQDPAFLRYDPSQPHSAVQMINQLARLGDASDVREGIDREVGRRVDELLGRVVAEYDANPGVFDEVVTELNPLIDRQTRTYRGNIERTVRASEGQQKLARARRAVLTELKTRFAGKDVADVLIALVSPGWRNLLVHAHLRHGEESSEWVNGWAVVDQVHGQITHGIEPGDDQYVNPNRLLRAIKEGLDSIAFDPAKRTPLIIRLSDVLVGDTAGEKVGVEMVNVPVADIARLFGLDGLLPDLDPDIDSGDASVHHTWNRALERARRVQVGEWLAMADDKGRPLILSVAFVGDDAGFFVLVNRKGIKSKELDLKELVDGLYQGRVTLLDDFDLPLMERASQRMLQNMHNQLTYQASHDELTQLFNRKEFERCVENAIRKARLDGDQHGLIYADLDQFKVVNNTSGHRAGDQLLQQVGEGLSRAMAARDALVARIGGDEFGVLLHGVTADDVRAAASDVLQTIRDMRFEWEGRRYNMTASVGLVLIDQTTETVDSAMRFADEACYTAKDSGRNRVQEYELGDSVVMARHGVMEWVSQLDKALDENRLVLNCQQIAPVDTSCGLTGHYEILLTMEDEIGTTMPPTDFITAAETYNRMTAVDRWVIEHVLRWMADHRKQLDKLGGFSINVSGHSINDETFADFVLDQFARTQAPTSKVCFEITETAAISSLDNAVDFMNRMKIIGCQFSLDDFGTGLSSYSYLRNLPVDFVKIDGVFVRDIAESPGDYAVVRSINEIGHYMGKRTIAEYVESEAILEQLREIGVDFVQGYQIDRPRPLNELIV